MMTELGDSRLHTPDPSELPQQTTQAFAEPGQTAADRSEEAVTNEELSPSEAVKLFHLSEATLRRLLAAGRIPARKVNGVRGREWRIPSSALESAGYSRRASTSEDPEVVPYAEVRRLQQLVATERARASQLDSQLGYAMLTIGRLRGRLRDAGINPDELFGGDYYDSLRPSHAPHMD